MLPSPVTSTNIPNHQACTYPTVQIPARSSNEVLQSLYSDMDLLAHLLVGRGSFQQSRLSRPPRVPHTHADSPSQRGSFTPKGLTLAFQVPSTSAKYRSGRCTRHPTGVRIYEEFTSILTGPIHRISRNWVTRKESESRGQGRRELSVGSSMYPLRSS